MGDALMTLWVGFLLIAGPALLFAGLWKIGDWLGKRRD